MGKQNLTKAELAAYAQLAAAAKKLRQAQRRAAARRRRKAKGVSS
jgi:hypothetical protein